jgi:hypothetical protein
LAFNFSLNVCPVIADLSGDTTDEIVVMIPSAMLQPVGSLNLNTTSLGPNGLLDLVAAINYVAGDTNVGRDCSPLSGNKW